MRRWGALGPRRTVPPTLKTKASLEDGSVDAIEMWMHPNSPSSEIRREKNPLLRTKGGDSAFWAGRMDPRRKRWKRTGRAIVWGPRILGAIEGKIAGGDGAEWSFQERRGRSQNLMVEGWGTARPSSHRSNAKRRIRGGGKKPEVTGAAASLGGAARESCEQGSERAMEVAERGGK